MTVQDEIIEDLQYVEDKLKSEEDKIFKAFWEGQRYALLRLLRDHHDEYDNKFKEFKEKWCEIDNR